MIFHRLLLEAVLARALIRLRRILGDRVTPMPLDANQRASLDWLHAEHPWVCPRGCPHPVPAGQA